MQRVVTISFFRDEAGTVQITDSVGGNRVHRYLTAQSRLDYIKGYQETLEEASCHLQHVNTTLVDGEKHFTHLYIG